MNMGTSPLAQAGRGERRIASPGGCCRPQHSAPLTSGGDRRIMGYAARWVWLISLAVASLGVTVRAEESWLQVLDRMPLGTGAIEINRTNCVRILLEAFTSNQVVKALIFMPGATDEFYMFRRARAKLSGPSPSLADGILALTNQSLIRATFRAPLLLLHTSEDPLDPDIVVSHPATADCLRRLVFPSHLCCDDRDWDILQPRLRSGIKMDIRPWKNSTDSWHFYRHSFAAWNVTGWEALECAALAGKSRFRVARHRITFEVDSRIQGWP
jgi:hypothetical protein